MVPGQLASTGHGHHAGRRRSVRRGTGPQPATDRRVPPPDSGGAQLAAIFWDASESLQDRETLRFDTTMTTLRILAGALRHEVRSLSLATATHASPKDFADPAVRDLGTVAQGLEMLSGLHDPPARV